MAAPPSIALRRVAAVMEVFGIFAAGPVVVGWITQVLPFQPTNPLPGIRVDISDTALLTASWQMCGLLLLLNGGWFLLIVPINAWHRRRGPGAYGLTRAGHSWSTLVLAGLGTAAFALGPTLGINLANTFYHLGETVAWRQALFDTSWQRWEFWVFMGVAGGGAALLEELFFRGYCQRRLAEDWADGPAIVGIACLVAFAHSQYLRFDAYNVGTMVSVLGGIAAFGVIFAATRSIVPCFIAHLLMNIPLTPLWQGVCLAACVVASVFVWRSGRERVRQVFSGAQELTCILLGVAGASCAVAAQKIGMLPRIGLGLVVGAVVLHVFERKRNARAAAPSFEK